MSGFVWSAPPSVPLFQWLARGSLKQNLAQAIRLWVGLHLLYGSKSDRLHLPEPFTYAHWRDGFFSATHPKADEKPLLHDCECPCAKVIAAWLFGDAFSLTQTEWKVALSQEDYHQQIQRRWRQFTQSLKQHDAVPDQLDELIWQTRLFGKTRRTLYSDLQTLVDICWLKRVGQQYHRVEQFPTHPAVVTHSGTESRLLGYDLEFLTQPDLALIADNLSQNLNGQRRFFVHLEYVVPQQQLDRVDEWQSQLRQLWLKTPVPPVLLQYRAAGRLELYPVVVFPVCLYYYQRGPYLCGFGQVPSVSQVGSEELNWRNYRLDRIESIMPLDWQDARVPEPLRSQQRDNTLPTAEEIQFRMEAAWGFDYYQPAQLLLLRFNREWNDRYIHNTLRHATFRPVSYQQAGYLIKQALQGEEQQRIVKLWRSRAPQDAYYRAMYRQDDPNVRQRIRAWRPHVEVLLPLELRQRMGREVEQEWKLYRDDEV